MADRTITRNRYGKHMRALLLILMQRPGQWYTIGRDNVTVQAAKALVKKRAIQMSEDGKRCRVLVGAVDAHVPRAKEAPDGWIVQSPLKDAPAIIELNGSIADALTSHGFTSRPFKYLD